MRLFLFALPVALAACAPPALQSTTPAAPFTVPMDPGTIPCAALSNPAALEAATQWALGKARAGAMAGTVAAIPNAGVLSADLAGFCRANPNSRLATAVRQMGL